MDKPITTKMHAIIDYITAALLFFSPDLLGFSGVGGAAVMIPRIIGLVLIFLELITDFELSIVKVVPIKVHLIIDLLAGIFLFLSPFIFNFNNEKTIAWAPHLVIGLMIFTVSLLSQDKVKTKR